MQMLLRVIVALRFVPRRQQLPNKTSSLRLAPSAATAVASARQRRAWIAGVSAMVGEALRGADVDFTAVCWPSVSKAWRSWMVHCKCMPLRQFAQLGSGAGRQFSRWSGCAAGRVCAGSAATTHIGRIAAVGIRPLAARLQALRMRFS